MWNGFEGYHPNDMAKLDGKMLWISECVWCDCFFLSVLKYGRYGWCEDCTRYDYADMQIDMRKA